MVLTIQLMRFLYAFALLIFIFQPSEGLCFILFKVATDNMWKPLLILTTDAMTSGLEPRHTTFHMALPDRANTRVVTNDQPMHNPILLSDHCAVLGWCLQWVKSGIEWTSVVLCIDFFSVFHSLYSIQFSKAIYFPNIFFYHNSEDLNLLNT